MSRITSRQHAVVQRLRALASRHRHEDAVLLDGEHLLADALAAGVPVELVLADGRLDPRLATSARASGATLYEGTASVLEAASPVRTPTGVVAIATWRPKALADALDRGPGLTVGLVDVQDPGNVGSVIRSADALGGGAVLALGESADPAGWRALRGAMGSTFRVPVARGSVTDAIAEAHGRSIRVMATVAGKGKPIDQADLSGPALVLLGNEGAGLPDEVTALADLLLTIPMRARVNSLNVATTAALVLWEARRRHTPGER